MMAPGVGVPSFGGSAAPVARHAPATNPGDDGPLLDHVTVIVVEDQPLDVEVVADALDPLGVHVVSLGDIAGRPAAPGQPGTATVLVADVGPGGIPVPELLASFHAARPNGAVVLMTDLINRRRALGAAGVNDVLLRKPFSAPDLRHAVARAVRNLDPKTRPHRAARTAA
jgi:DNA-binding NtrC family response regulator